MAKAKIHLIPQPATLGLPTKSQPFLHAVYIQSMRFTCMEMLMASSAARFAAAIRIVVLFWLPTKGASADFTPPTCLACPTLENVTTKTHRNAVPYSASGQESILRRHLHRHQVHIRIRLGLLLLTTIRLGLLRLDHRTQCAA